MLYAPPFTQLEGKREMADIRSDLRTGDPRPLEWFFAVYKICWGTWLLLPLHTFATAPTLFRYASILPEWFYGALWLALGVLQFYAYYRQSQIWRYRLVMVGGYTWSAYGLLLWLGDHRSSALVTFGVMVIFKMLAAYWLKPPQRR